MSQTLKIRSSSAVNAQSGKMRFCAPRSRHLTVYSEPLDERLQVPKTPFYKKSTSISFRTFRDYCLAGTGSFTLLWGIIGIQDRYKKQITNIIVQQRDRLRLALIILPGSEVALMIGMLHFHRYGNQTAVKNNKFGDLEKLKHLKS